MLHNYGVLMKLILFLLSVWWIIVCCLESLQSNGITWGLALMGERDVVCLVLG